MRKGMLHTVEAIMAFLIIIGFIVLVMPTVEREMQNSKQTRLYIYEALSSMEKSGKLQSLAAAENISGIKTELDKSLALPLKFTVELSRMNTSYGTLYPGAENPKYINFTADKSVLDSATLNLDYSIASDPSVYINGQYIVGHTGDYSGNEETFEITSPVQTGANSIKINTSNGATINYRLIIMDSADIGPAAENTSITSVSYITSGNGTSFAPKEIRVYVWR